MSAAKHTPEPWSFFDTGLNGFAVAHQIGTATRRHAMVPYRERTHGICEGFEEAEANARLIAAAPELLAELEKIIEDNQYEIDHNGQICIDLEGAKRIVALAKGGV